MSAPGRILIRYVPSFIFFLLVEWLLLFRWSYAIFILNCKGMELFHVGVGLLGAHLPGNISVTDLLNKLFISLAMENFFICLNELLVTVGVFGLKGAVNRHKAR